MPEITRLEMLFKYIIFAQWAKEFLGDRKPNTFIFWSSSVYAGFCFSHIRMKYEEWIQQVLYGGYEVHL